MTSSIVTLVSKINIIDFFMGVTTSIVAMIVWQLYDKYVSNRPLKQLEGYWFEMIAESQDRKYSIGKISYNRRQKTYNLDGVNYMNNGEPVCKWESISLDIDFVNNKIYYTFKASFINNLNEENYGFGVINLNRELIPINGHYIEAAIHGLPYSHTMEKLGKIVDELGVKRKSNESMEQFFSRIVEDKNTMLT